MKKIMLAFVLMLNVMSCTPEKSGEGNSPAGNSRTETPPAKVEEKKTEETFKFEANAQYKVSIETNYGKMELKLFSKEAPKAVENFTRLAAKGYYDGIIFHRIIADFMIQGGDPLGNGTGGESVFGKPFEDEFAPSLTFNRKGLLAMANSGPATNGSQFFITLAPTDWLNNKHTIFGEITGGMDILEKIGKVKTGEGDRPIEPVTMKKVTVSK